MKDKAAIKSNDSRSTVVLCNFYRNILSNDETKCVKGGGEEKRNSNTYVLCVRVQGIGTEIIIITFLVTEGG